nr:hypothetical protein BaRGS_007847 [Batillaria attramentaria]
MAKSEDGSSPSGAGSGPGDKRKGKKQRKQSEVTTHAEDCSNYVGDIPNVDQLTPNNIDLAMESGEFIFTDVDLPSKEQEFTVVIKKKKRSPPQAPNYGQNNSPSYGVRSAYPVSYATMVATPRPSVDSSKAESVCSSMDGGGSGEWQSPMVWKGREGHERRHSIGSSPEDLAKAAGSTLRQRSGSQEMLFRESAKEAADKDAAVSLPGNKGLCQSESAGSFADTASAGSDADSARGGSEAGSDPSDVFVPTVTIVADSKKPSVIVPVGPIPAPAVISEAPSSKPPSEKPALEAPPVMAAQPLGALPDGCIALKLGEGLTQGPANGKSRQITFRMHKGLETNGSFNLAEAANYFQREWNKIEKLKEKDPAAVKVYNGE